MASPSDGDLWATCGADDGALYSANGAGRGFSAGTNGDEPVWNADIGARVAVLHDERREYPGTVTAGDCSVLSQGGVLYNAPMRRYLYTSWTEYTAT